MWWPKSVIPSPKRLRQEDLELEASLRYTVKPYLAEGKKEGGREGGREAGRRGGKG
jgi:hypothetical protein